MVGEISWFLVALLAIASIEILAIFAHHLTKKHHPGLRIVGNVLHTIAFLLIVGSFLEFMSQVWKWNWTFIR